MKLEEAGAFAITLECVPTDIATEITKALHTAATIGIGAGNGTDGQVLVCTDLLGMSNGFRPKFVKTYADLHQTIVDAVGSTSTTSRTAASPTKPTLRRRPGSRQSHERIGGGSR